MNYTNKYKLKKPEGTDNVNINDLNDNSESLEALLSKINSNITSLTYNKADIKQPTFVVSAKIKKLSDPEDENSDYLPEESLLSESDLNKALEVKNLDL